MFPPSLNPTQIRQGSCYVTTLLLVLYVSAALLGLSTTSSSGSSSNASVNRGSIPDPYFTVMEVLILAVIPPLLLTMAILYERLHNAWSLAALACITLTAGITSCVHATVLMVHHTSWSIYSTTSNISAIPMHDQQVYEYDPYDYRDPAETLSPTHTGADAMLDYLFDFEWPSVVYMLDILAWDWFFGLAMLCAACGIPWGTRLERTIRVLMLLSSLFSLAGLLALPVGIMQVRVVGTVGYAFIPIFIFLLLGIWMGRTMIPSTSVNHSATNSVTTLPLLHNNEPNTVKVLDSSTKTSHPPTAPPTPEKPILFPVELNHSHADTEV